jgi:hypothetical protein
MRRIIPYIIEKNPNHQPVNLLNNPSKVRQSSPINPMNQVVFGFWAGVSESKLNTDITPKKI